MYRKGGTSFFRGRLHWQPPSVGLLLDPVLEVTSYRVLLRLFWRLCWTGLLKNPAKKGESSAKTWKCVWHGFLARSSLRHLKCALLFCWSKRMATPLDGCAGFRTAAFLAKNLSLLQVILATSFFSPTQGREQSTYAMHWIQPDDIFKVKQIRFYVFSPKRNSQHVLAEMFCNHGAFLGANLKVAETFSPQFESGKPCLLTLSLTFATSTDTHRVHENGHRKHKLGVADVIGYVLSIGSVRGKLLLFTRLVLRLRGGYGEPFGPAPLEVSVVATASFATVSDSSALDMSDFEDGESNGGIISATQQSPFMGFTNPDPSWPRGDPNPLPPPSGTQLVSSRFVVVNSSTTLHQHGKGHLPWDSRHLDLCARRLSPPPASAKIVIISLMVACPPPSSKPSRSRTWTSSSSVRWTAVSGRKTPRKSHLHSSQLLVAMFTAGASTKNFGSAAASDSPFAFVFVAGMSLFVICFTVRAWFAWPCSRLCARCPTPPRPRTQLHTPKLGTLPKWYWSVPWWPPIFDAALRGRSPPHSYGTRPPAPKNLKWMRFVVLSTAASTPRLCTLACLLFLPPSMKE